MKIAKSTVTTTPAIVTYVVQWLDSQTAEELARKAQSGYSLTQDLRSVEWQVRAAKAFVPLRVDATDLLTQVMNQRPQHGQVLSSHRDWYIREIEALRAYIESL